ncbi:MAG: 3'-5' exonuclease [Cephaloticoccus sp.]|nr:3'-5' exonuclease [Cephaloticoccus sp.]
MPNTWIEQPVHFVDFEGSLSSGVVEYGLVTLRLGRVEAAHTRLCRPTGRMRPEDIAVHGLDEAALNGAGPMGDDFARFTAWRESGPLAAHFAGVENSLLKSVWPYPRVSPDFARPGRQATDWGPWIDTGAIYRQLYPQLASLKLADLVTTCSLQGELDGLAAQHCPSARCRYHAALYDALAGAVLLLALAREPKVADLSVMQLLALSTLDGDRRSAIEQDTLF